MGMALLKEEGEDLAMKVVSLEERTNKLENIVNEISKEVRSVLSDVRGTITELDNPMNFLKGLGIDEVMLSMAENITESKLKEFMEKRLEAMTRTVVEGKLRELVDQLIKKFVDEQIGAIIEGKIKELRAKGILNVPIDTDELKKVMDEKLSEVIKFDDVRTALREDLLKTVKSELEERLKVEIEALKQSLPETSLSDDAIASALKERSNSGNIPCSPGTKTTAGIVGLTACAGALMRLSGRKGSERIIDDYYKRGLISDEIRSALLRLISIISAKDLPDEREVGIDDQVMMTYLFNKLTDGGSDTDFLITLMLLGKTSHYSFESRLS